MEKVIISVVGNDRPGIVSALSSALFRLECNIESISQTILQSVFGAILIAGAPDGFPPQKLKETLDEAVSPLGLDVTVRPFPESEAPSSPTPEDGAPFVITTMGPDKKGLVASATKVMADYNVNITNLKAVFKGGDNPLDNMMIYEVTIPGEVVLSDLYRDLETAADGLGLQINIQHRHIFEAMNRI
jgi:glycine cleavage system transcriptional repressor